MNETPFPLPEEFYEFIKSHANEDPTRLRLEFHSKPMSFDVEFAITQIECRRKFAKKLPSLVADPHFVFPSVVAGEQSTNEFVAKFHVGLIGDDDAAKPANVIDMTAGLGVDAISFAIAGHSVMAIELDLLKQQCLLHNAKSLELTDLRSVCADSTHLFATPTFDSGDIIFIDPHRRDAKGSRVYGLKDCLPDVTEMLPCWAGSKARVFLKLSPMLDIEQTLRDLPNAKNVWVVCFKGECKEVLVETALDGQISDAPTDSHEVMLTAVDLNESGEVSEFTCSYEFSRIATPCITDKTEIEPGNYLYIPSAGVMKLGAWGALCARFPGLYKLSASTPLFVSSWIYRTFPGKVLTIDRFLGSSDLKRMKGEPMTVISRNYPLTADQIRKKVALKEGEDRTLVGCRIGSSATPTLMVCSKPDLE